MPFYGDAAFMTQVRDRLSHTAQVRCPLSRTMVPVLEAQGLEAAVTGKPLPGATGVAGVNFQVVFVLVVLYFFWPMISNAVMGSSSGHNAPSHYNGRR